MLPASSPPSPLSDSAPFASKGTKIGLSRRRWQLCVLLSALAHGLLLAVPLPAAIETEEIEPEDVEIIQESAMDVSFLPQVAVPEATPPKSASPRNNEAPRHQTHNQTPQRLPQEIQPNQGPPRFEDIDQQLEETPSKVEELLDGSSNISSEDTPIGSSEPTLEQKLADTDSYEWDGMDSSARAEAGRVRGYEYFSQGIYLTKLSDENALRLPYLPTICLENPPVKGRLLVQVSVNGEIEVKDILISTGYEILDEKAKEEILMGNYIFQAENETTYYALDVEIGYEDAGCAK